MNLPNKITLTRILLIPLIVFFYLASFIPYGKLVAVLLFIIASLTDFVDGRIARKRGLVTTLGNFLDTIADKLLVMAGIILVVACPVVANGGTESAEAIISPYYIGVIIAVVIIGRELMVMALRSLAASKGIVLKADMYGKVKATFQFITIIYYLIYAFLVEEFYYAIDGTANSVIAIVGYVLLAITLILTIISACNYFFKNIHVFKDEPKKEDVKLVESESSKEKTEEK